MSALPPSMIENDHRLRERLLPEVYDLTLHVGADPHQIRATVRLEQSGRMRQIGDALDGVQREAGNLDTALRVRLAGANEQHIFASNATT